MRLSFGAPFLGALAAFLDSNIAVISASRLLPSLLSTPSTSISLRRVVAMREARSGSASSMAGIASTARRSSSSSVKNWSRTMVLKAASERSAAGVFAHALKQAEPTLVGDALGHTDVEKSADSRLARTALRNVPCQLIDPLGDEGAIDRVDTRPVTWRGVGGLKPGQRLQQRRAVNGVKRRLQEAVPHVAVGLQRGLDCLPHPLLCLPQGVVRGDRLAVLAHVFGH